MDSGSRVAFSTKLDLSTEYLKEIIVALRYLIRRPNPEDLNDIKSRVKNLDMQLGTAGEGYLREVRETVSPTQGILYSFKTRKSGTGWTWICHSMELVAEGEPGLFSMLEIFKIPKPMHLTV